jgi:hypothetical protein
VRVFTWLAAFAALLALGLVLESMLVILAAALMLFGAAIQAGRDWQ